MRRRIQIQIQICLSASASVRYILRNWHSQRGCWLRVMSFENSVFFAGPGKAKHNWYLAPYKSLILFKISRENFVSVQPSYYFTCAFWCGGHSLFHGLVSNVLSNWCILARARSCMLGWVANFKSWHPALQSDPVCNIFVFVFVFVFVFEFVFVFVFGKSMELCVGVSSKYKVLPPCPTIWSCL